VWEVLREDEFSPLKNAEGAARDTPTTCRQDLIDLHRRWAIKAGATLVSDDGATMSHIQRSVHLSVSQSVSVCMCHCLLTCVVGVCMLLQ